MKEQTYKKLIQCLSMINKDEKRFVTYDKIVILINTARILDDEKMLEITFERINNFEYKLHNIEKLEKSMVEIGKTLMSYYGDSCNNDADVKTFIEKIKSTDLYKKMLHNSAKNSVFIHCFNEGFLDSILKDKGLNTFIDKSKFSTLNEALKKIDMEISSYYINHSGMVYFSKNPESSSVDYAASSPEWFRIFIEQFGVFCDEYEDREFDKIVDKIRKKFDEIEKSEILSTNELSIVKEFVENNVLLLCKKNNPYMLIYQAEEQLPSFEKFKDESNESLMKYLEYNMFTCEEVTHDGVFDIEDLHIVEIPIYHEKKSNKLDEQKVKVKKI